MNDVRRRNAVSSYEGMTRGDEAETDCLLADMCFVLALWSQICSVERQQQPLWALISTEMSVVIFLWTFYLIRSM